MKNLEKTPSKTPAKPFGTLYHHQMGKTHGSVVITPRNLTNKDKIRRTIGAGITSAAMALYIYSFGPMTQAQLTPSVEPHPVTASLSVPEAVASDSPVTSEIKDTSYSVYIPFLKAKSEVFPDIDPFNENEYSEALSKGVAQAKGTANPGEGLRIFLFAHSTNSILNIQRYNAIFYDLGSVPTGEVVELYYHGKIYQYRVVEQKIVSATDVSWVAPHDGEELILQTCYPPGTSWKRLLVVAQPI